MDAKSHRTDTYATMGIAMMKKISNLQTVNCYEKTCIKCLSESI